MERPIERRFKRGKEAKKILFIADNSAEIAVDRLLIEELPEGRVTVAVRGGPAINDALMEDALEAGIDEVATVIDTGLTLPGVVLLKCSKEFQNHFNSADLIISKGQGNFETMSDERAPIVFLLRAKCEMVTEHIGCKRGDFVISSFYA